MTAAADPQKPKKKVSLSVVWRESKEIIWSRRRRLVLGFVLLVISRLAGLVLPATTKVLIDEVIGKNRPELLLWIAVAAGGAAAVQSVTSFSLSIVLGAAAQRAINDLRIRIHRHVMRLPVRFFEERKSGELISRILSDAEGVRNLVGTGFVQLVGGLMTSSFALAIMFWLNWRLTLVTVILLLAFGAVMAFGFLRLRPIFRERNQLNAELTGRLNEALGGVRVVKAYTAEKREERIFASKAHKLLRLVIKSVIGVSAITSLSTLIFGLVGVAMSILGAREVLAGRMSIGDIFMFVVFTGMMVTPLIQMSAIGTQITEAFAGLDRVREILEEKTEDAADRDRAPVERIQGRIELRDVTFSYKPGVPVLQGVSFVSEPGTTTALVGHSGAGKSTVIGLVMGFRRPDSGVVLVDGRDLTGLRLRDYRRQLAVVLQDDFLFDGTVAENISYSRPGATREELEEAGRLARCDEFVLGFPDGYDTVIGERGIKLSGGQRQRLTIARAILADPRLLILDEATSSLDSENELLIQQGIRALKRGRTTFVIAHRLSTIRNADQILVMRQGRIVEQGRHRQLLALDGEYADLYKKQYRFERDLFVNPGEELRPAG
ncbi:MAG: ABC transporter ATP-binding protein [Thermoanaerobaculia bacterium]|nr:ABC transporter ATP-binding protein [Thermoanaerobaculia bacterium]